MLGNKQNNNTESNNKDYDSSYDYHECCCCDENDTENSNTNNILIKLGFYVTLCNVFLLTTSLLFGFGAILFSSRK